MSAIEGQERERDHEADELRHDEHFHWVHAHHIERVDLLTRLRLADFRREFRTRAASDQDSGDQDTISRSTDTATRLTVKSSPP